MADIVWLPGDWLKTASDLGLMSAPGFVSRDAEQDLAELKSMGVAAIVSLVPEEELYLYGIGPLSELIAEYGFQSRRLVIPDGGVGELQPTLELVDWIIEQLAANSKVAIHCIGGLGRSGTIAACCLVRRGKLPGESIKLVRQVRTGAIETARQEIFIADFADFVAKLS